MGTVGKGLIPLLALVVVACSNKNATISASVTRLGLAAGGSARKITISNLSTTRKARAVTFSATPALPAGTTLSPADCGDIGIGAACEITISPGATPSAAEGDAAAVPIVLTIDGTNTEPVTVTLNVITLGSVYQGGYVFALDDTTAVTGSVGGKVAALESLAAAVPDGIIWSSNGNGPQTADAVLNNLSGISETSSAPTDACDGKSDGACNSRVILAYYSPPTTDPAIDLSYFAAGLCGRYRGGDFADWYLPAICELGYDNDTAGSGCGSAASPFMANMQTQLKDRGLGSLAGSYWSSTQGAGDSNSAWYHFFDVGTNQRTIAKFIQGGVRCARALSP